MITIIYVCIYVFIYLVCDGKSLDIRDYIFISHKNYETAT